MNRIASPFRHTLALAAVASATFAIAQTQPKPLTASPPEYPAAAQQAGHHGIVHLQLTVKADGTPSDIKLAKSSRSKELDDAVLAVVPNWTFTPATDAQGQAIDATVMVPFEFEPGSAVSHLGKPCKEVVVETRWFQQAFPELKVSDTKMYRRTLGYLVVMSKDPLALSRRFGAAYEKTLAECAATPDARFWDMLSANAR